uniref:Uncharacterized protein n=1 Tax=Caenorhabditis japonica TaxID=281687 RepID=A0A8R1EDJ2_CAEJA
MRELKITDLERIGETWSGLHNLVWIHVIGVFGSMSLVLQTLCLKASWFSFRFIAMQIFIEFETCRMMFHLVSSDFVDCL